MSAKANRRAAGAVWDAGSARLQRGVLCACVVVLTYWAVSGPLFFYFGGLQRALVVGVVAGLIGGLWVATGSAVGVGLLGLFLGPNNVWDSTQSSMPLAALWVVVAGLVAAGTVLLGGRFVASRRWLLWGVVGLMVANMWVTVISVDTTKLVDQNGRAYASVYDSLAGDLNMPLDQSDGRLYAWIVSKMRSGTGYYRAFADSRPALTPGFPGFSNVYNFREPLLYEFAARTPPWFLLGAQLLLLSGAAVGLIGLLRGIVKLPVAIPGVAAVLSFSVVAAATVPLYAEVWAGALCLIALELAAVSSRRERFKPWLVGAACAALLAFLIRELAAFAPIAGLVAAALSTKDERRAFKLSVWGSAVALAVVGYVWHAIVASHYLVSTPAAQAANAVVIDPAHAFRGLVYGATALGFAAGPQVLLPALLAVLGIVGIYFLPTKETQLMAAGLVTSIFALGLVAANGVKTAAGIDANYWGITAQFIVYGCIPLAFALLPVARVGQSGANRGSR